MKVGSKFNRNLIAFYRILAGVALGAAASVRCRDRFGLDVVADAWVDLLSQVAGTVWT